ncbi:MAG TPA: hypothetical protein VKX39_00960 [Bryobacteraceae bacterium]|jgi:hypothetical protein|nr:hypothetical protein [Bryobacteraceae bacterium]
MTGLIVKGSTAFFVEGNDPGAQDALGLVNRLRGGNTRSLETKLTALNLRLAARPAELSRQSLAWAYVFLTLTEGDEQRLEPGPFDDELAGIVMSIETEQQNADARGETSE